MNKLILKPKEDYRIKAGHLWVFSNEIDKITDLGENGQLVEVVNSNGQFLGQAYYNRHTLIAARFLTRKREEINTDFFVRRLQEAKIWREHIYGTDCSCRLVYSEGDFLPGVIIDRYDKYLVVQILTLGMENLREYLLESIIEVFKPEGILFRNDSAFRKLEGLELETEVVFGIIPDKVIIEEVGARFNIDMKEGQKTGFFFDQRDTRALVKQLAIKQKVLDCFSYTGGFSINSALGGATSVMAVDESSPALEILQENTHINKINNIVTTLQGNCFNILRDFHSHKNQFDLIILDPPAFIKSKSNLKSGLSGYREINRSAMRLLAPGGILVTCSCSQNLNIEDFKNIIFQAAISTGKHFFLRNFFTQAQDHPVLQAMPETQYLKGFVLQTL